MPGSRSRALAGKDLAVEQVQWQRLAEEVLTGMRDWRAQHPRATFTEIEEALDARLSRLRTRLLADVALASATTDGATGGADMACPTCGGALEPRGQQIRAVTVRDNQTVTLRRGYAACSECGAGGFPPG